MCENTWWKTIEIVKCQLVVVLIRRYSLVLGSMFFEEVNMNGYLKISEVVENGELKKNKSILYA